MAGHKRSGGERSNAYSESKFTNWSRYDPYGLEIWSNAPAPDPEVILKKGGIFLHAFPKDWLKRHWRKLPKPSLVREYTSTLQTVTHKA